MNNAFSAETLFEAFPLALKNDPKMVLLARVLALWFAKHLEEIPKEIVYKNIDTADEQLIDILAHDFHVEWYDYDLPLEAKREVLKRSFYVHRHLGTVAAVKVALSAIYPETLVEEWFQYGGDPYYFRVVVDITEPRGHLSNADILRAVMIYKSLRSWLEDGAISYRLRCELVVETSFHWVVYSTRITGTYPNRARHGKIDEDAIIVETDKTERAYSNPHTDQLTTGTYPSRARHGRILDADINVETDAEDGMASPKLTGTVPDRARHGSINQNGLIVETDTAGGDYFSRLTGTVPDRATHGSMQTDGIIAETGGSMDNNYGTPAAHTIRTGQFPVKGIVEPAATVTAEGGNTGIGAKLCGSLF